jgi:hypothetical protein
VRRIVWLLKPAKLSAGAGAAAQVPTHLTPFGMIAPPVQDGNHRDPTPVNENVATTPTIRGYQPAEHITPHATPSPAITQTTPQLGPASTNPLPTRT